MASNRKKGHILCRLPPESREISELGRFMKDKIQAGNKAYFVIQEEYRGQHAKQLHIEPDVIDRMIKGQRFSMEKAEIELSSKIATTEILLCLAVGKRFPISRFPRSLLQDEDSTERSKHNLAYPPLESIDL